MYNRYQKEEYDAKCRIEYQERLWEISLLEAEELRVEIGRSNFWKTIDVDLLAGVMNNDLSKELGHKTLRDQKDCILSVILSKQC